MGRDTNRDIEASPALYGDSFGELYDVIYADFPPEAGQLDYIARLVGSSGTAIEVGVGTGRLAIPLASRGVRVVGVDPSQQMLAALREKPGGDQVECIVGTVSAAKTRERAVQVVYAPFNVLFAIPGDVEKRQFFRDVHELLCQNGHLIIECFVPRPGIRLVDGAEPALFPESSHLELRHMSDKCVSILASKNDLKQQVWDLNEIIFSVDYGMRMIPMSIHYKDCEQIDEMADSAGFTLTSRTSTWSGEPFNGSSVKHVSTYVKA